MTAALPPLGTDWDGQLALCEQGTTRLVTTLRACIAVNGIDADLGLQLIDVLTTQMGAIRTLHGIASRIMEDE